MSEKSSVLPPGLAAGGAYTPGVVCDGWLYVSGQGPLEAGRVVAGTIEQETTLTLRNVEKVLLAGGCSFDDVVKCTVHLSSIADFDRFNAVYATFFPGIKPARTTVQSVLWGGIKVEIDAIARVRKT